MGRSKETEEYRPHIILRTQQRQLERKSYTVIIIKIDLLNKDRRKDFINWKIYCLLLENLMSTFTTEIVRNYQPVIVTYPYMYFIWLGYHFFFSLAVIILIYKKENVLYIFIFLINYNSIQYFCKLQNHKQV